MLQTLPWHALIVHMPIALTVLVPLFVLLAFGLGRRTLPAHKVWSLPVGMLALLLVSAVVAEKTGEREEDRVEKVVAREAIHEHEEAAELFVAITAGTLLVSVGGLLSNRAGAALRLAGAAGSLLILAAEWKVGHSGGSLVYEHNAGAAYAPAPPGP